MAILFYFLSLYLSYHVLCLYPLSLYDIIFAKFLLPVYGQVFHCLHCKPE
jgi:hypothetical protein